MKDLIPRINQILEGDGQVGFDVPEEYEVRLSYLPFGDGSYNFRIPVDKDLRGIGLRQYLVSKALGKAVFRYFKNRNCSNSEKRSIIRNSYPSALKHASYHMVESRNNGFQKHSQLSLNVKETVFTKYLINLKIYHPDENEEKDFYGVLLEIYAEKDDNKTCVVSSYSTNNYVSLKEGLKSLRNWVEKLHAVDLCNTKLWNRLISSEEFSKLEEWWKTQILNALRYEGPSKEEVLEFPVDD
jgi:hypothetical protein